MRVAVPCKGRSLDDALDKTFGRCANLVIVETDTMACECAEDDAGPSLGGAGVTMAQRVLNTDATVLLCYTCGPNALKVLQEAGVEVITNADGPVRAALNGFLQGRTR